VLAFAVGEMRQMLESLCHRSPSPSAWPGYLSVALLELPYRTWERFVEAFVPAPAVPLEYANFLIEILAPQAPSPFRLAGATRREMLRPQVRVDDSNSWALGWEIHQTTHGDLIQHEGGQAGFLAFTAASVDRRSGYVILTNSANGWKVFLNDRFVSLIDRIFLE